MLPAALHRGCFVTGTDTGVGKTVAACALLGILRDAGIGARGFKPFCCGVREDAERLAAASGPGHTVEDVNPFWYRTPAAPCAAAFIENRLPDIAHVLGMFQQLQRRAEAVVVEGAGGWLVPVTREVTLANLAKEMALPVVLVAPNRLGVLNHALLTARAVSQEGCALAGWIFNDLPGAYPEDEAAARATNRSMLEHLLECPLLGTLSSEGTFTPA